MVRVHPDPPVFPLKPVLSEGSWYPTKNPKVWTLMNTWFSVHKDEQFLEDHDVQMNAI